MIDLSVRVRPNAKVTEILGVLADGSVKIALHAPAEDGKANRELIRFLAETHGVPQSAVTIVSGQAARIKRVRISTE